MAAAGRVTGKVALVTGAARGMGRAHAVRLAREGADVIVLDVCAPLPSVAYPGASRDDLHETVRLVEVAGRRAVAIVADVRDHDLLCSEVAVAVDRLGGLDIIVANAGICVVAPWDRATPEILRDTLDINVVGVWNTVMAGAPHLVARGGGSVILISSAAGLKVQPYMVHYTASKFAVTGMAKAFAVELAKDSIRVNSVHPTGVETGMSAGGGLQAAIGAAIEANPRPAGMFTNMLPVERVAAEDVADAVLFLASDESKHVTALAMTVDAGVTQY
ncbi:mycofactocin-coupled SDR family oxidoreductase [Aeromicrobium sp. S22]|uniref:mycofactocin-coupled SDR family oxidoreductase n=1 Tax=Aeromicrobium sp. S22 TaxID=2662029 RepID=UPI00129E9392|nr:mycofactocin-coupled SDR family oxidoreductase [Aeromicrobium sp. S22]MRK01702.1 mycofactocin-coupled SDR family oxidoreductase [Aeromicrobium sp. S22]